MPYVTHWSYGVRKIDRFTKVIFFKTTPPIEPVKFIISFLEDAAKPSQRRQARAVRRLTPVSLVGKATEKGIEELAKQVLAPHFHQEDQESRKVCLNQPFNSLQL
jgi:tRNA acetyltransferase TAN1